MPEHALSHLSRQLDIQVGQHSVAGLKSDNDDAVGIRIPEGSSLTTKGAVAVIADGVSTAESGKEASQIAVTSFLSDYYSTHDSWSIQTSGLKVLVALNRWLYGLGQSYASAEKGFITTFSALILKSAGAYIFHVGDSRIYRLRDGDFELLTRDHATPAGNGHRYLARALGIDVNLEIDFYQFNLLPGDRFLLTTDGIHDWMSNEQLQRHLGSITDPQQTCTAIAEEALANGSDDNLSVQLLCVNHTGPAEKDDVLSYLRTLPCPPPLSKGHILDDWRVLEELHANNRSEVYLVENTADNTKAILKAPSSLNIDDPAYLERFVLEEWIGSRIHNANIVKVLRPRNSRKFLYYLTEYVQGPTLAQLLKERTRLSVVDARNIITQVASGLRAFHRKDTLHQDIKPENIIYSDKGVKIIDFGSAHIAGINEIETTIERSNQLGTKGYSAPEYQLGQRAGQYSDQFSLGILLYELLTGKHPYGSQYQKAVTAKDFSLLNYTPSYEYNSLIPAWMDMAIQKAVSLNPKQRYSALSEFITDLNTANPTFTTMNQRPYLERNPLRFWKATAILLFLSNLVLLFLLNR